MNTAILVFLALIVAIKEPPAGMTYKGEDGKPIIGHQVAMQYVRAHSAAHAEMIALKEAKRIFPIDEGWGHHEVTVDQIPPSTLKEICQDQ